MRGSAGLLVVGLVAALAVLPAALAEAPMAPEEEGFVRLSANLPHAPSEALPPDVLDPIESGKPLLLDLMINAPLTPSLRGPDGTYAQPESCTYGVVEASAVSVPTGSNHMLIHAELGSPVNHPANLLACEYDPSQIMELTPGVRWRLKGCFLPHAVSIPTATLWQLNPLPASACGIGD